MTLLQQIVEQARAWSLLEVIAVAAATVYLVLAIRQNIWCWLFAAISTTTYIGLFIAAKLYMESVLNAFYLVMAFYGWYSWTSGHLELHERPVVVWPYEWHAIAIVVITSITLINGYLLQSFTDAAFPYVDSATTWFAIWATFLVARKVLENWWYWLLIDAASILIYWQRDLQLTSLLFAVYVCLIPIGLMSWSRSMRRQER